MAVIYLVTNTINNKFYVGQTRQLMKRRWSRHLLDARKGMDLRFYRAIRKYGEAAFDIQEIACSNCEKEINRLEKFWIGLLGTTNPNFGYNDTYGGEGGKMTAEVCAKKSISSRAAWTPERRQSASIARKGKLTGEKNPMFGKGAWRGKKHSTETKSRISETRKTLFSDPQFKQRMAEANRGKHHTSEGRKNISAALKGNQYRKGIPHSDEVKKKIAEGVRRAKAAKLVNLTNS